MGIHSNGQVFHLQLQGNLENVMDKIAEIVDQKEGDTWLSTLDLKYEYGQVELNPQTARHCNFQIVGGGATGIYRYKTAFYGLTIMPTEFQRIMDMILQKIRNVFAFIDDIMLVTKGSKEEHMEKLTKTKVLAVLDSANVRINL